MSPLMVRLTRVWMTVVFIGLVLAVAMLPVSLSLGQDETATPTEQEVPTVAAPPTATETPVPAETPSPTATWTETPSPSETASPTATPTETESPTPTETATVTEPTTPADSETPPPIITETPIASDTPTPTDTETPSPIITETPTPTMEIATPTPTSDSASWTVYADTDALLVYGNGTWQTFAVAGAAGGTLTATADTGATLTAWFEGTGIRVVYSRGPEGRSFSGQVDDLPARMADGYGEGYSYGYSLNFDNLPDGPHTLTVTNGEGAIWVEAVEVQGVLLAPLADTPTPTVTAASVWITYPDTDARLVYANGVWQTFSVDQAAGGTLTATADEGATLSAEFEGTGVRVIYAQGPEGESFTVWVDGELVQTASGAAETYSYGAVVAVEGLAAASHTLTVVNGNGAIWIDAVDVAGVLLAPKETPTETPEAAPEAASAELSSGASLEAVTFTVNTTADTSDANTGDGVCDTDLATEGEQCSLRAAIQQANATVGLDTINFNIPGTGTHTITPTSALPTLTDPATIDGYTQPGAAPATDTTPATLLIELNGSSSGNVNGFSVTAGGSTIKGLVINRFSGSGIKLAVNGSNAIQGNYLGTNIMGDADLGNLTAGVHISDSPDNTIGGVSAAARNIISGNNYAGIYIEGYGATGNIIQGNYIGTDVTGTVGLGNTDGIFTYLASSTTIGGPTAEARNLISGNGRYGILLTGPANVVQGNYIGTDVTGIVALGNGLGVALAGSINSSVGGTGAGEANTIAFNGSGVTIGGTSNRILSNAIFSNGGLGIDLGADGVTANDAGDGDTGSNNLQNYPFLSSVSPSGGNVVIEGALNSTASTTFRIEVYANTDCDSSGYGEGETFIGFTDATTDGAGNTTFTVTLPAPAGPFITATATDPANNSSEFSDCAQVGVTPSTTVTNTNDTGTGSLRRAILSSNASVGVLDTIDFNIPGPGPHTITPSSPLPAITDPVIIDGYTQPGAAPATDSTPASLLIELRSSSLWGRGLMITAGGTTIKGLVINHFSSGITLSGNGGNIIQGNYIGTDVTGSIWKGNINGVSVDNSLNNLIGGTTAAARNVISANQYDGIKIVSAGATGNLVQGNYIGTDATGTVEKHNGIMGVRISNASNNTIGGSSAGTRNLISGNYSYGVYISSASGNVIQGNYIGTDATGSYDIGNSSGVGVSEGASNNNTIGGTMPGEANIIAFNGGGVSIGSGTGNSILSNSIFSNDGAGIVLSGETGNDYGDVDTGANNLQNYPFLSSVTLSGGDYVITGVLNSTASMTFRIEFFANVVCDPSGYGEGETFIGFTHVTTDGAGNTTFTLMLPAPAGQFITATATDPGNNTSEFSDCAEVGVTPTTTVTNTNDSGTGSLRKAILVSNASVGVLDTITFNIPGPGPHTITPLSRLPAIMDPVIIDGYTQPGAAPATSTTAATLMIELNGSSAGSYAVSGLIIAAGGSTIQGLAINRFSEYGIKLGGAGGNIIQGNHIGTDVAGAVDLGNGASGLLIDNAPNNTIGGVTAAARNVISGNSDGVLIIGSGAAANQVQGNYIGTNAAGTAALGNSYGGLSISNAPDNIIGGTAVGARNVISGNSILGVNGGIRIAGTGATGNLVQGNYIGANAAGTDALGNFRNGVLISGAPANTIGGTTPSARNVISANSLQGIAIEGADAAGNLVQGNYIGTNAVGTGALGNNRNGVYIYNAPNNIIGGTAAGEGNLITNNGWNGVQISPPSLGDAATGNRILSNTIFSNGELGINLGLDGVTPNDSGDSDTGANNLQNHPFLTSIIPDGGNLVITGMLYSTADTAFRIELFANTTCDSSGFGEGQTFFGSTDVTTDGSGYVSFTATLPAPAGQLITATATDSANSTSEFSGCAEVGSVMGSTVVTNTNDSGPGSLRQAIIFSNATFDTVDTITFDIPGPGIKTIMPTSALPTITDAVIIDGTTQPGYAGVPLIELNGSSAGFGPDGLTITSGGSTVRGLIINGFRDNGIELYGNSGNVIQGNYIGTDAAGNAAQPNSRSGILIEGSTNNIIGGATAETRNLISGNSFIGVQIRGGNNLVQGNAIGTDVTGTVDLGNGGSGVVIDNAPGNVIGGTTPAARNLISGNNGYGILIYGNGATGNVIQGNAIGTDVTGTKVLGNNWGVRIVAPNTIVGGTTAGAGNVIAFNGGAGVEIISDTGTRILSNAIFSNAGLGIDLEGNGVTANDLGDGDGGVNNHQNFPVITTVTPGDGDVVISGALNSTAITAFRIEFFSNFYCDPLSYGEGQTFLGFTDVTTDASGNVSFTVTMPATANPFITATATDPANNTSEFSACARAVTATTVINTNDSGPGSLREAILISNTSVGVLDTIDFHIPGTGVQVITPLSPLPEITDPVIIDGYAQIGSESARGANPATLRIELNGHSAGDGADGLHITSGNTTVKGLVINRFSDDAIELAVNGGNIIEGNRLGTDATGALNLGNILGVFVNNTPNNLIGGTTPAARNLISANLYGGIEIVYAGATGNLVQGNYIGINAAGTAPLGNGGPVEGIEWPGVYIYLAPNNTIGGTMAGARNVISGNVGEGILIWGSSATGNMVQGNYIGSNAFGYDVVANGGAGVYIGEASSNLIGGTTISARNVIADNQKWGVVIDGSGGAATGNLVQGNDIRDNNYPGILIYKASNNTVGGSDAGAGNSISNNSYGGVVLNTGTGNAILSNAIFDNNTLGIDLYPPLGVTANDAGDGDTGSNQQQNYPVLSSITVVGSDITINGMLNSRPNTTFRVEFFANVSCDPSGYGEGQTLLGFTTVTTNGAGNATFSVPFATPSNVYLTATATDPAHNTSEFSKCLTPKVTAAPGLLLPAANALTTDNTPTFTWNSVPNAGTYELQVATDTAFAHVEFAASGLSTTQTPGTTLSDGRHYWRVRGTGLVGPPGPWSAARQFTVDTVPLATAATVKSPANWSIVAAARPAFAWMALTGAARYRLQADDDPTFDSLAVNVVVTTTTYTIPNASPALPQGVYHWRVLAIDPAGNEGTNWSIAPQFTVNIQTAPANNVYTTDTTPTFTWAGVAGTTGHQLQVATDSTFTSPVSGYPLSLGAVMTYTPTTPLGYGTYYWRVLRQAETPVDVVYRRLTVTPPLPAAPGLITPAAGAQTNNQTPEFTWNTVTGAATYEIQVDNTSTFSTTLEFAAIDAPTSQTATTLNPGKYSWRVRAINTYNAPGAWSLARSFTVDTLAPAAPTLTAPANGAVVSATRPTMTWGAVATAIRYRVDLDDNGDFSSRVVSDGVATLTSFKPPTNLPQGTYVWRVQAVDAAGNVGDESAVRTFTVFIGTAPADGLFTTDTTPTFTWAAVTGATGYALQVDDDTDFSADLVLDRPLGVVTTFTTTTPLLNGIYYWRVLVTGETPVTNVYRTLFIGMGTAPAAPALINPANAALLNDSTPAFQWSAVTPPAGVLLVDYELQVATTSTFTLGMQTFTSLDPSFTPGLPLSEGIHYWRVRARFAVAAPGKWSAYRSFTIDTVAPATPTLIAPVDTAVIVSTRTPTLTWSVPATAKAYMVEVSTDAEFTALVVDHVVVTTTTYTIPNALALANGPYYWRVSALDGAGNLGASSPPRTFIIALPN